jgi:hypothetical protein
MELSNGNARCRGVSLPQRLENYLTELYRNTNAESRYFLLLGVGVFTHAA